MIQEVREFKVQRRYRQSRCYRHGRLTGRYWFWSTGDTGSTGSQGQKVIPGTKEIRAVLVLRATQEIKVLLETQVFRGDTGVAGTKGDTGNAWC